MRRIDEHAAETIAQVGLQQYKWQQVLLMKMKRIRIYSGNIPSLVDMFSQASSKRSLQYQVDIQKSIFLFKALAESGLHLAESGLCLAEHLLERVHQLLSIIQHWLHGSQHSHQGFLGVNQLLSIFGHGLDLVGIQTVNRLYQS